MSQPGGCTSLAPEARKPVLVRGERLREHLDRDRPVEDGIFGKPDRCRSASPEAAFQDVSPATQAGAFADGADHRERIRSRSSMTAITDPYTAIAPASRNSASEKPPVRTPIVSRPARLAAFTSQTVSPTMTASRV